MSKKTEKNKIQETKEELPAIEDIQDTIPDEELPSIKDIKPAKDEEIEQKPAQISAKQFAKKLKLEFKDVPARVFVAFVKIVPPIDTEENYQKIWKTTFKRQ